MACNQVFLLALSQVTYLLLINIYYVHTVRSKVTFFPYAHECDIICMQSDPQMRDSAQ